MSARPREPGQAPPRRPVNVLWNVHTQANPITSDGKRGGLFRNSKETMRRRIPRLGLDGRPALGPRTAQGTCLRLCPYSGRWHFHDTVSKPAGTAPWGQEPQPNHLLIPFLLPTLQAQPHSTYSMSTDFLQKNEKQPSGHLSKIYIHLVTLHFNPPVCPERLRDESPLLGLALWAFSRLPCWGPDRLVPGIAHASP